MTTPTADKRRPAVEPPAAPPRPEKHACGSIKRHMPEPCKKPAGWGTDHLGAGTCRIHGGATPSHRIRAKRILAERAVDTYGLPRDVPAEVALLEELARTAGHVAWLFERVRREAPEALVWGQVEELERGSGEFPGVDRKRAAGASAYLELYIRERKHLLEVSKTVAGLGIAERQVRINEAMAADMFRVLAAALDELGLTAAQRDLLPEVLARHVGALTVGQPRAIGGR